MSLKIEVLYYDAANLFADIQNVNYIKKSVPETEIFYTDLDEEPRFVSEDVDLVFIGSMTEKGQELVISALKPYMDAFKKRMDSNKTILVTGNAVECFSQYIENEDGSKIEGLGLFDTVVKRDMMHRYNTLVLGEYAGIKIVGFKSQFTQTYGNNDDNYFIKVLRGTGINKESNLEGYKINNFYATSLLGPFLIMNPIFTEKFIKTLGVEKTHIAYSDVAIEAYNQRVKEFENLKTKFES